MWADSTGEWFVLKTGGICAAIAGALIAFASLLMTTSVHTDGDYRYGTFIPSADTLNIGLLQNQQFVFLAGCTLFLAGFILFAAGSIGEAIGISRTTALNVRESDAPPEDGSAPAALPGQPATFSRPRSEAEKDKDKTALVVLGIVGALALLVVAILSLGHSPASRSDAAAQVEANADMLADNMEMQADNLEAMADNATGSTR